MAAPKCKLCGSNHWSREPCKFDSKPSDSPASDSSPVKTPQKPKPEPIPRVEPVETPQKATNQVEKDRENTRRWREQNRERYRELQREYMRKRRKQ